MAHWLDVDGTLDGSNANIYSEGLQMPIVKIYREGVINQEGIALRPLSVREGFGGDGCSAGVLCRSINSSRLDDPSHLNWTIPSLPGLVAPSTPDRLPRRREML